MTARALIPPAVARCTPRPITGRRLAAWAATATVEEIREHRPGPPCTVDYRAV